MFIGVSFGSIGGGIKIIIFVILFNSIKVVLKGRDKVLCY